MRLGNSKSREATSFSRYPPLKLGEPRTEEIKYEGRHLFTDEVVEQMEIKLPLLQILSGPLLFSGTNLKR